MSQRLIRPGLSAASRIIGYKHGLPVWLAMGGAPDDDTDDSKYTGDDDHDSDDDESDDDDDEDKDDDKAKKTKKNKKSTEDDDYDDEDDKPRYTQAEYDKIKARMKAADKRAADTEARLKALENKDRKPDEITAEETAAAKARADKLAEENRQYRLEVAFFKANVVDWVDPDDALRLVDLSDVDVDEDGIVDRRALARALRDLAKRKPHLVKKAKSSGPADDDDDEDDDDGDQGSRRSAAPMNGKRKGSRGTTDREALAKKFPALQRR